jgi:hypothetical protein
LEALSSAPQLLASGRGAVCETSVLMSNEEQSNAPSLVALLNKSQRLKLEAAARLQESRELQQKMEKQRARKKPARKLK